MVLFCDAIVPMYKKVKPLHSSIGLAVIRTKNSDDSFTVWFDLYSNCEFRLVSFGILNKANEDGATGIYMYVYYPVNVSRKPSSIY